MLPPLGSTGMPVEETPEGEPGAALVQMLSPFCPMTGVRIHSTWQSPKATFWPSRP